MIKHFNLQKPKVAVVILSWNGQEMLTEYLPSVLLSTYENLEIIVADNASMDKTTTLVPKLFPEVKLITLSENLGFAGGYNAALKQVDADYYVLLNQDVEVERNWIEPVIELMEENKKIAACQPKIRAMFDKTYFEYAGAAGGFIDQFGYPFCRGRIFDTLEKDNRQYDSNMEVFWATGAAMFVRADVFHRFGGFDADFFAHMEEIDLCWRLKNAGYAIYCCPDSVVYHLGGGSLPKSNPIKTYLNYRNNLAMMLKNLPGNSVFRKILFRFVLDFIALLKHYIHFEFNHAFAIHKAHFRFLTNLSKWLRHRKETIVIKKENRIGPANQTGYLKGSIVYTYFLKKKQKFSDIVN
jgi:GT2 family glycosyltransferase